MPSPPLNLRLDSNLRSPRTSNLCLQYCNAHSTTFSCQRLSLPGARDRRPRASLASVDETKLEHCDREQSSSTNASFLITEHGRRDAVQGVGIVEEVNTLAGHYLFPEYFPEYRTWFLRCNYKPWTLPIFSPLFHDPQVCEPFSRHMIHLSPTTSPVV